MRKTNGVMFDRGEWNVDSIRLSRFLFCDAGTPAAVGFILFNCQII